MAAGVALLFFPGLELVLREVVASFKNVRYTSFYQKISVPPTGESLSATGKSEFEKTSMKVDDVIVINHSPVTRRLTKARRNIVLRAISTETHNRIYIINS